MQLLRSNLFEDASSVDEVSYAKERLEEVLHDLKWRHYDTREALGAFRFYGWLAIAISGLGFWNERFGASLCLIIGGLLAILSGTILRALVKRRKEAVEREIESLSSAADRAYERIHQRLMWAEMFSQTSSGPR